MKFLLFHDSPSPFVLLGYVLYDMNSWSLFVFFPRECLYVKVLLPKDMIPFAASPCLLWETFVSPMCFWIDDTETTLITFYFWSPN